jgi:predicted RNase H-like HicB family nuclease
METSRYEMIVWWSAEDNAFVVDVPELPGCMAHGNTRAEAIANAEEAVAFWLQTAKEDGIAIREGLLKAGEADAFGERLSPLMDELNLILAA